MTTTREVSAREARDVKRAAQAEQNARDIVAAFQSEQAQLTNALAIIARTVALPMSDTPNWLDVGELVRLRRELFDIADRLDASASN